MLSSLIPFVFSFLQKQITDITVFLLLFSVMVGSFKTIWMLTKLLKITALHELTGRYFATPVSLKNALFIRFFIFQTLQLLQSNAPFISKDSL